MHTSRKQILQAERRIGPPATGRSLPLVVVCYPNSYPVGMSNLAFHFLLHRLSGLRLRVERAFALPQAQGGRARTFESNEEISHARVICATVSYEDDLLQLVNLLRAAGLPLHSSERGRGDPLLILGGNAISANPTVVAPMADAIALGEFDGGDPLFDVIERFARAEMSRDQCLETLQRDAHMYVPAFDGGGGEAVTRECTKLPTGYEAVASTIISPYSHFPDTLLIEINRSCVSSCRFCLASYLSKPFRVASRDSIIEQCERWRGRASAVGLIGTAVTSYPGFESLCDEIRSMGFSVRLSSLRIEGLKRRTLELIADLGIRTVTLAPETADERLRRCMGKRVSDETVGKVLAETDRLRFAKVKLYYMYGLPGEGDEDRGRIVDRVAVFRNTYKNNKIEYSINCLVPKAATPMQWVPLANAKEIDRRRRLIVTAAKRKLRETPVLASSANVLLQAALSLGDRETGEILIRGEATRGAVLRRLRTEHPRFEHMLHEEKGKDYRFAWDRITTGATKAVLFRDYSRIAACVDRRE